MSRAYGVLTMSLVHLLTVIADTVVLRPSGFNPLAIPSACAFCIVYTVSILTVILVSLNVQLRDEPLDASISQLLRHTREILFEPILHIYLPVTGDVI